MRMMKMYEGRPSLSGSSMRQCCVVVGGVCLVLCDGSVWWCLAVVFSGVVW